MRRCRLWPAGAAVPALALALVGCGAAGSGTSAPSPAVSGWVCIGFDTPQVLRTGQTSKCTKDSSEILAVLPSPS